MLLRCASRNLRLTLNSVFPLLSVFQLTQRLGVVFYSSPLCWILEYTFSYNACERVAQLCSCCVDWKMNLQPDVGVTVCPDVDVEHCWTRAAFCELRTQVLLLKWKASCLWRSFVSSFAWPCCEVSPLVLPHPHLLLHGPGHMLRSQQLPRTLWRGHQDAGSQRCAGQEAGLGHGRVHGLWPVYLEFTSWASA